MFEERLEAFRVKNGGQLPSRVLVYRDGVSEVRLTLFRVLAHTDPSV